MFRTKTLRDYTGNEFSPLGARFSDSKTADVYTVVGFSSSGDRQDVAIKRSDAPERTDFVPLDEHLDDRKYTFGMAVSDRITDFWNTFFTNYI